MARKDTGLTLKSLVGILMAVLLTHHCVLSLSTDLKIDDSYASLSTNIKDSVKVTNFRSGSIIADYKISLTANGASGANSEDFTSANTEAFQTLSKAGIPATINAFFETGSKSVMEDFLKTVDILVSDQATASWQNLTKENTSISLLSAVEDISNRLTEGSFSIKQKYIELNRNVINNSYTGKSHLTNSATEILIPQVLNPCGCEVKPVRNESGIITCECSHTTSFSVLMSPFSIDHITLAYVTYIGVGISVACLILCLSFEAIVWKAVRRNDTSYMRHVSIINIAISLLIADICFIIGAAILDEEQPTPVDRCSSVVFFMHLFYLALFFWVLISALLLFYRVVMVLSLMSRAEMMVIAFLLGYCAPLLIAVITVASTAGPQNYVSKEACWLNWDESKNLLAFGIPALTIVAINLVFFIVVLYKIFKRRAGAATQPDGKHALVVARCVAIFTPAFACGITWGFGIGTTVSADLFVHVVFALFNSLQGFFILVFGTLLDSKVREELARSFSLRNLNSSSCTRTMMSCKRLVVCCKRLMSSERRVCCERLVMSCGL
ncbi:LOW QUALITY PROTEIN: adhesion G-protein coupled receptor F1 [Danio aesculapii]|uniref:LOW QUALITY PROTEIN: adhesion G-protein coupled receptor F1 n=1 Tax=Danio aesculapii TaxID=1142201 RepID=UPI0024BF3D84|nr:LOW QUALITY PROTEIN: adhesion G-protein coupled receptor F1 [Danio aesculapii]